ncbi:MAG: type II toxin-antitoxin system RelE/ParE family toxin [Rhodopila sp.]
MPRRRVRMSPAARAWYLAEVGYLAERNADAAARVVDMFRTARLNLSEHPELGCVGLILGTRRLMVGPYVLTIRLRGGTVEIAAIKWARQGNAYEPAEAKDEDGGVG